MTEFGSRYFAIACLVAATALTIAFVGSSVGRWAALLPCALWFVAGAAAARAWSRGDRRT